MSKWFISNHDALTATPITPIITKEFSPWLERQNSRIKNWLKANDFTAKPGTICLLGNREGKIKQVFLGIKNKEDSDSFAVLPNKLPEGNYHIRMPLRRANLTKIAFAWGLGSYKFAEYKKELISKAKLVLPEDFAITDLEQKLQTFYLIRDLINSPAEDMGPAQLAKAVTSVAIEFDASVKQITGDDLLKEGLNAIHAVGRASNRAPRLIELRWGKEKHPKVTLVGKGVCFDSGGLNLKPDNGLTDMKSDMGGAAHVLGLARMIMAAKLPVNLHVLIPAVENMIGGNSLKPGDIITSYKKITIEIGNTDAEGRLILADALALACNEKPDILIDFATLTGAASVALGDKIGALFSNQNCITNKILDFAQKTGESLWPMPLYQPYRKLLDTDIADIKNCGNTRLGGAITAALFLQEFVAKDIPWVHFDISGVNDDNSPGHPKGGDVRGLLTTFNYLQYKYGT